MISMKRVVIIGGGFAGSKAAKRLEKNFDVTLIDTKDYFEFTAGILRTIVEPEHLSSLQVYHNKYLKKTKLILAKVDEVTKDYVLADKTKYFYDYLLIASGSSYASPIKDHDVVISARGEHLRAAHEQLEKAKDILIIGGGLVGVELSGEICTRYKDKNIIIVHAKDGLIQRNDRITRKYVTKFLSKRGVKIILGEIMINKKNGMYLTDKGTAVKADISFLCTGINPNTSFMKHNMPKTLDEKNQVKVNSFMQVDGYVNIFSVGDTNDSPVEKTAQNAIDQALIAAKNIEAIEKITTLSKYKAGKTPLCISLGKWNGVLETTHFVMRGLLPGLLKGLIEKIEMFKLKYLP